MSEYLTTKELAELLRIKERKVYDLAATGEIPCSRAMGKLLFPRAAVEAWLASASSGLDRAGEVQSRPNVFLGSHDPLLDWALRESGCGLATYFDGSLDGLERFAAGEGIASGLHIYEPAAKQW
ncbi:MAG: helix-turn-helix domain-containing protein, partial [Hyphomicrobiaceae bacterium]